MDLQQVIQAVESVRIVLGPLPATSEGIPDLDNYTNQAHLVRQLAQLKTSLERAMAYSAQYHAVLEKHHAAQTTAIKKIIGERAEKSSPLREASLSGSTNTVKKSIPKALGRTAIEVTTGVTIGAHVVQSFTQVTSNGELYYIPHCDHFAVRINGKLLHGNVGSIYPADKSPERIKECRFIPCGNENCEFYHDPYKHVGRKDRRNYTTMSWLYVPADARRTNDNRGRRIGNRDSLAGDLATCSPEEASKFRDQAFHDLLCALLV